MPNEQIHISLPPTLKKSFEQICSVKYYDRSKVVAGLIEKWVEEELRSQETKGGI